MAGDVRRLVSIVEFYLQTFLFQILCVMLAGTNMPRVSTDEQEAGKGKARAASDSSQVTMAPLGNGFFLLSQSLPHRAGNHYILTISNYSKFAWAKALPTKEAAGVVPNASNFNFVPNASHFKFVPNTAHFTVQLIFILST